MSGHRSHLKQKNKAHKSGHSAKNQYKTIAKNLPGQRIRDEKGQKDRRLQANENLRKQKTEYAQYIKAIGTKNGPPKVVGFFPCTDGVDVNDFISNFTLEEDPRYPGDNFKTVCISSGQFAHRIIPIPMQRNLESVLDATKSADVIVFIFNQGEMPFQLDGEDYAESVFDDYGLYLLSVMKSMGFPTVMTVIFSPNGAEIPKAHVVTARRLIQTQLPDVDRVIPVANEYDCGQFVRFLSVASPANIAWKSNRPTVFVQNYSINQDRTVTVEGYVRNAPLSINQIVTIPNVGDFHIRAANDMYSSEATRHPMIYEQDGPTDEINEEIRPPQTIDVPQGIEPLRPEDYPNPMPAEDGEEDGDEEEDGPVIMEDDQDEDDDDAILQHPREEDELEFEDEFDYDNTVVLRDRLSRYISLKSFRKSPWHPYMNLPPHYARLFEFPAYARTSESAVAEQAEGEVAPGERVTIILIARDDEEITSWRRIPAGHPVTLFGLFRNETRYTVLNCTFNCTLGPDEFVASKTPLLMVCGFRHMWVCPLFSDADRSDKHFFLRKAFGHAPGTPDTTIFASFVAPAVMASAPVTYFHSIDGEIRLCATGSVRTVDPSRLIIKQIRITGVPYRASGNHARISMMFWNREDLAYFRTVTLYTKNNNQGHITASIGTRGNFKAVFAKTVHQQDTVYMCLYRRVFPPMVREIDGETREFPAPALF